MLTGPDQLWAADITYVALPSCFIYVAIVVDAWSRLVVGYALGRSIDARLTVTALKVASGYQFGMVMKRSTRSVRPCICARFNAVLPS